MHYIIKDVTKASLSKTGNSFVHREYLWNVWVESPSKIEQTFVYRVFNSKNDSI